MVLLSGLVLVIQMVSGILLSMHCTPHIALSFLSIEFVMRQVELGWFFRYTHANGASMFFGAIYLHIARGIFYSSYSYPRGPLWVSGVVIFILVMATSFLGSVLLWGHISFWGCYFYYKYGDYSTLYWSRTCGVVLVWVYCPKPYLKPYL